MARLQTNTRPTQVRDGFTLIELLIVILIIAILATLLTLGVNKAMNYAKQVATKTEMAQIEQALGVAAIEMGRVPFFPSYLILLQKPADYDAYSGQDKAFADMSRRILTQMFPKWTQASWAPAGQVVKLSPESAFVFFLNGNSGNGFSLGPDPWATGQGKRYGPYYGFKTDRVEYGPTGLPVGYRDYWDNPGAYLIVYSQMMVGGNPANPRPDEAPSQPVGARPGRQLQNGKFFMPKGYQIFSAGKDGKWGIGYGGNNFNGNLVGPGEDDQSNFSESPHGKPVVD